MWGTRFLSAFLKVNPYFTVCLAVGFSGLAAVGFNHSATDRSLNRLIPLHLRSLLPDRAPDVITTDLQGMEHAREVIHTIPRPQGSDVPHEPSGFGHVLLSDPPRKTVQWQGGAPAGSDLPIDYGFVRDVPDQPRYDMNKPPEKTIDPPDVPSPPSPPAPWWSDQLPPAIGSGSPAPEFQHAFVPSSFFSEPVVAQQDTPPPPDTPPSDVVPPVLVLPSDPGTISVDVAEPPMLLAFAALLPLLVGLRRRSPAPLGVRS